MNRLTLIFTLVATGLSGACGAKTPLPAPTTRRDNPPGPATPPAGPIEVESTTDPAGLSPRTRDLLQKQEEAGRKYPAIRADISYEVVNPKLGDSETRVGWLTFHRGNEKQHARFRVHFDTLRQDEGRTVKDQLDYAFDGRWLTVLKHRVKQMARYEIVAKDEKVQPLKLGKGPFPLPFGQEVDDVIKFFKPTTRELRKGEPKDTDYLKLVPHAKYRARMAFTRLEMWINRKGLPVKTISLDHSKNITTVIFKNIKTPKSFPDNMFRLRRKAGWTYREKPLDPMKSD